MLIIQQEAVGRAANAASVHVFSDDLAGVVDPILLRPRDRGTVLRLQSAGEFAYAAVDLTQTYRSDRAYYDNAEVASVVREFLYIRNLEALAICDHVETVSPDTPRRFSLHGTNAPQVSGLTALFQAGCQEL